MEQAIDEITVTRHSNGWPPIGKLNEFLDIGVKENSCKYHEQGVMLGELLKEHETIITSLKKNIDVCDERSGHNGTTSFLTKLMKEHEAIVCILKRYLNKALQNLSN